MARKGSSADDRCRTPFLRRVTFGGAPGCHLSTNRLEFLLNVPKPSLNAATALHVCDSHARLGASEVSTSFLSVSPRLDKNVPFEVFHKSSAPLTKVPTLTIQTRGLFSINRSAYALIDNAEAVEFLYDPERSVVGLRPAPLEAPNAYPVRPQNASTDTGPLLIAGTAFTKFHNIDTTRARRWVPYVEDGILCVDLNAPSQTVISNRSKSKGGGE